MSATIKACGQWQLAIELLTMASCQMIQPSIDTWPWIKWAGVRLNEFHQIYLRKSTSMVGLQITVVRSSGYVTMCGMSFSLGLFGASYLHFSSLFQPQISHPVWLDLGDGDSTNHLWTIHPTKMSYKKQSRLHSLKLTYPLEIGAPWKRRFRAWKPSIFRGELLVLGRVWKKNPRSNLWGIYRNQRLAEFYIQMIQPC